MLQIIDSPIQQFEYIKLSIEIILEVIIEKYNLQKNGTPRVCLHGDYESYL